MEYLRLPTLLGEVVLRDVAEPDLDALVGYWHGGTAEFEFLGVETDKLGTPSDTRERFRRSIRGGVPDQKTVAFVLALDDRVIGYTNVNFRGRDGYAHVHVIDPDARNRGLASFLVPFAFEVFFTRLPIECLVLEVRTRNTRIHRVLEKVGLRPAETLHLESPDGLAGPGEFHVYRVTPSMVDEALSKVLGMAKARGPTRARLARGSGDWGSSPTS